MTYKARDLTGLRSGKLTAVKPTNERIHGKVVWLCKCDCGNTAHILGTLITRKVEPYKSCGCLVEEHCKPNGGGFRGALRSYRRGARLRGLCWELTDEQAAALFSADCFYCGVAPSTTFRHFTYNGIDRKDSKQGYTIENSVPCCATCNYAKAATPFDVWMGWIKRIVAHNTAPKDTKQ